MLSLDDVDQLGKETSIEVLSGRFQARFVFKDKHVLSDTAHACHDLDYLPVVDDASLVYRAHYTFKCA